MQTISVNGSRILCLSHPENQKNRCDKYVTGMGAVKGEVETKRKIGYDYFKPKSSLCLIVSWRMFCTQKTNTVCFERGKKIDIGH